MFKPPLLTQALLLAVGMHGAAIATVHRLGLDPLECHANAPATLLSGPLATVINNKNYSTPIASTTAASALLLTPQGILAGLPAEPSPVMGLAAGLVSFTAFCEPDHVRVANLRADMASYAACRACPGSSRSLGGLAHECESCNETTCARADETVFNTTFDASGTPPLKRPWHTCTPVDLMPNVFISTTVHRPRLGVGRHCSWRDHKPYARGALELSRTHDRGVDDASRGICDLATACWHTHMNC